MSKNGVREGGIWMAGCWAGAGVAAGMMACSCDGMMAGCWVSAGVGAGMVVCSSDGIEVMAGCLVGRVVVLGSAELGGGFKLLILVATWR